MQQTLGDVRAINWIQTINPMQQRILKLLATGDHTQSQVAERLRITRQYVSQFVKKLLEKGLLKKRGGPHWVVRYWTKSKKGVVTAFRELCNTKADAAEFVKRVSKYSTKPPEVEYQKSSSKYNIWYELDPRLKSQVEKATPDVQYSACRVHNIRLKYKITELTGEICTDHRTRYFTSWEMRGGTRHKFFIKGTEGKPDITIDVHPKTIVAYPDAGQTVYAESIEESETLIIAAIHEAVLTFLLKQRQFNTHIEIKNPSLAGKIISKIHYGFKFLKNSPFAQEQTDLEDFWVDGSPEKNGEKGYSEFETENKAAATSFDRCIKWMMDAGKEGNKNPFLVIFNELEKINRQMRILVDVTQGDEKNGM